MNVDWKEVRYVMLAGAAGGLLSWVNAQVLLQPDQLEWWKAVPFSVALGAGAAPIGVYVVANVDMRSPIRSLVFAMLCGFAWKPVFEAGSALISQQATRSNDKQLLALVEAADKEVQTLLASASTEAEAALMAKNVVERVLEASRVLDGASPEVRRAFAQKAPSLLDKVFTKPLDPATKTELQEKIKEAPDWKLRRRSPD